MQSIRLYDQHNIHSLNWPTTEDGDYARRYLAPLIGDGPQTYIANVHTQMTVLQAGDVVLPVTISDCYPGNSYVCSPYNQYINYGQEELSKLNNRAGELAVRALLAPLAWLFRQGQFDKVVMVNNWLLSTNLYPVLTVNQICATSKFLQATFPEHAILFRSVDPHGNRLLHGTLRTLGFQMVFSRQVYYMDVRDPRITSKKQFKIDLSKHRKSEYALVDGAELTQADLRRVRELYNDLYLEKYSCHNPQFTEDFLRLAHDQQLLTLKAFRKAGRIDAALGYFWRTSAAGHTVMTQPLFGYDTNLPQSLGLYRLLSTQIALEGIKYHRLVHCSAGVGEFKRLRGAVPSLEYNAVYHQHLPRRRQLPWCVLKSLMDKLAIPIIQKYGF
jgi:hypothetical protein